MDYRILSSKNNAEGQLFASIDASTLTFLLNAGEGDEFPTGHKDTTTSSGTSTTLNCTGIQAELSAIGITDADFFIRNITDGSSAKVTAINTDSLTTTILKGGIGNTWDNSDEFAIGSCVLTLNKRDGSGSITTFENVLIKYVDNGTDTIYVEQRGYASTSALPFAKDDYISLLMGESLLKGLQDSIAVLFEEKAENSEVLKKDGSVGMTGNLDMNSNNIEDVADPVNDQDAATKKWVSDNFQVGGATAPYEALLPAGESLTEGKGIFMDTPSLLADVTISTGYCYFGYNSASYEEIAFRVVGTGVSASSMKIAMAKNGSPTDNITVRIETDCSGDPSGTLADPNATSTFTGSSLTTSATDKSFTFDGAFTLTKGVVYHVRVKRVGGLSTSNYYKLGIGNNTHTSFFKVKQYGSSTWTWRSTYPARWSDFAGGAGAMAMKTSTTYEKSVDLMGFATGTYAEGAEAKIDCARCPNVALSLTQGEKYYLNTSGNLTTSSNAYSVGLAISDSKIERRLDFNDFVSPDDATKVDIVTLSGSSPASSGNFDKVVSHSLGRVPKWVMIKANASSNQNQPWYGTFDPAETIYFSHNYLYYAGSESITLVSVKDATPTQLTVTMNRSHASSRSYNTQMLVVG